jgi:hypothetical protein
VRSRIEAAIVRRRISLGSGLNREKLVDTIRQIADTEFDSPALICNSASSEHAWLHLAASRAIAIGDSLGIQSWTITFGVKRVELIEILGHSHVAFDFKFSQSPDEDLFGIITVGSTARSDEIAGLMIDIMLRVQSVDKPGSVEIILEYP